MRADEVSPGRRPPPLEGQRPIDEASFVQANTTLRAPAFVPEIRLHLADDPIELWTRTEQVLGRGQLPPPFWAFAWAGGLALARYVLDHPELVAGRRVLDLAAGSGLVALAAARAGAAAVTANDIDPVAAVATRLNARANRLAVTASCADLLARSARGVDVVLAGDVFYSREMAGRVLDFVDRAHRGSVSVLLGDPGRAYLPRSRLEPLAVYQVPVPETLEDAPVKTATVWRLRDRAVVLSSPA